MKHGDAIRLVSTKELSRQQWLTIRTGGIGSSDAAAAVGLSPYKSPLALWMEKTGRQAPNDLGQSESVFWGTTLEPVLARVYSERTGNKVRRVNAILQHPDHPFMLANLDRAIGGEGVLEIKTAGYHSAPFWEEGIPEAYQCQVLHQLAVTGKLWADVAVLIAGQDFRIYRVERDDDKVDALIECEEAFWDKVRRDEPPAVDGSESSGKALARLYPHDFGATLDCTGSETLNTLFAELLSFKRQRIQLEFLESTHRQTIQAAMGEASEAIFAGGRVTWKNARDSAVTDVKRLLQEHPELAAQYATTIPGSRRFLMQVDKPATIQKEAS
ncbi:YqaJ viral recombinase family nuclease [Thauera sinica]|uniref:YqaJ viral recombinase family protein n=1 Tax=Thauera sinica TaxID=2665146 RepID=A0ABW1ASS5_9RHOO|nr:YqaJ viral recombinase family protein [Thauera sp. K11]ATE58990.1 endonuclease [Thauera sp. K11]